jgi:hypothetical protein
MAGAGRTNRAAGGAARVALLLLSGALPACQSTQPRTDQIAATQAAATQPAMPTDSSAALTSWLADQPFVTAEAASRAVYALWRGEMFSGDFAALRGELAAGGLVATGWDAPADQHISRGVAARMIARAIDLPPGVDSWLTGLGRYAWRDLQFHNIAGPGGDLPRIGGGEFVGLLGRADEYRDQRERGRTPRVELGARPPAAGQE